jgi:hypothetical protein
LVLATSVFAQNRFNQAFNNNQDPSVQNNNSNNPSQGNSPRRSGRTNRAANFKGQQVIQGGGTQAGGSAAIKAKRDKIETNKMINQVTGGKGTKDCPKDARFDRTKFGCVCISNNMNPVGGKCPPTSCPGGQEVSGYNCVCSIDKQLPNPTGQCKKLCPDGSKGYDCSGKCAEGQVWDTTTNTCRLPKGCELEAVNLQTECNSCTAATGANWTNGACECSLPTKKWDGTTCVDKSLCEMSPFNFRPKCKACEESNGKWENGSCDCSNHNNPHILLNKTTNKCEDTCGAGTACHSCEAADSGGKWNKILSKCKCSAPKILNATTGKCYTPGVCDLIENDISKTVCQDCQATTGATWDGSECSCTTSGYIWNQTDKTCDENCGAGTDCKDCKDSSGTWSNGLCTCGPDKELKEGKCVDKETCIDGTACFTCENSGGLWGGTSCKCSSPFKLNPATGGCYKPTSGGDGGGGEDGKDECGETGNDNEEFQEDATTECDVE